MSQSAIPSVAPGRQTEEGGRPDLRVVHPRVRVRVLPYLLLVLMIGGSAVFGTLSLSALATEDAVRARELTDDVVRLERHYARLVADVAALEDPGRIAQVAEERGLVRELQPRLLMVDRPLPADGALDIASLVTDDADEMKPLLSAER